VSYTDEQCTDNVHPHTFYVTWIAVVEEYSGLALAANAVSMLPVTVWVNAPRTSGMRIQYK
jgi:hypothetical protein